MTAEARFHIAFTTAGRKILVGTDEDDDLLWGAAVLHSVAHVIILPAGRDWLDTNLTPEEATRVLNLLDTP